MFERFTLETKRVLACAQNEALDLKHNYMGTEHLLLALLSKEGIAGHVLKSIDLTYKKTRELVEVTVYRGEAEDGQTGVLPNLSPRLRRVLSLSLREALHIGHSYIGTEHLLLGLLEEETAMGTRILERQGVNLSHVRRITIQQIEVVHVELRKENAELRERVGELQSTLAELSARIYLQKINVPLDLPWLEEWYEMIDAALFPKQEEEEGQLEQ